ncbi:pantothenate kinase [Microcoleus sp. FACHB-1515]|uniref:pantothenate kinase n=1 Tax=Cyanophyceae TaxID=3028117 RepID=UPI001681DFD3|nr:pantothenate kinase [Microcoleus sp. FACHB-1515]MBD2090445.1 pantothenate kinase [Microcoleus sp. FACHB-1515]
MSAGESQTWLALAIGNSRLHWGWFDRTNLLQAWDTEHLSADRIRELAIGHLDWQQLPDFPAIGSLPELWLVSTVPEQTEWWRSYPHLHAIARSDIPLNNLYPTLGIDRALAAWGAGQQAGFPMLVIDGGTALTLTGINEAAELVGGAILPGLRLQWRSLAQSTAALPEVSELAGLPDRWATNTADAIRSGVMHSVIAGLHGFIVDWRQQFPQSAIVMTGGDGALLHQMLIQFGVARLSYQPHLLLESLAKLRSMLARAEE